MLVVGAIAGGHVREMGSRLADPSSSLGFQQCLNKIPNHMHSDQSKRELKNFYQSGLGLSVIEF